MNVDTSVATTIIKIQNSVILQNSLVLHFISVNFSLKPESQATTDLFSLTIE